jgi:predicted membrane chloride channel (bestrophin family)
VSGGIDDASEPLKARILQLESDLAHQLQEHLRRVDDVRALRARLAAAEENAMHDREAFASKMAAERSYSESLKAERDALRAALEDILAQDPLQSAVENIARAALRGGKEAA